jgi:hypothetical protein
MRLEDETDVVRRGGVGVECVERLCVLRVGVGVCMGIRPRFTTDSPFTRTRSTTQRNGMKKYS